MSSAMSSRIATMPLLSPLAPPYSPSNVVGGGVGASPARLERLLADTAHLREREAVVRVELLQGHHRSPHELHGLLVVALRRQVLRVLLRALVGRVLLLLVQVLDLLLDLLNLLLRSRDRGGQAVDRLSVRVDLLRLHLGRLRVLHALLLATLLVRQVGLLLSLEVSEHRIDRLNHLLERILLVDLRLLLHRKHGRQGRDARVLRHRGGLADRGEAELAAVVVLLLQLDEALGIEGLLERVARVVRAQHADGLVDARNLLRAKALALRPVRRLLLARRLRVREEALVALILALQVALLGLGRR